MDVTYFMQFAQSASHFNGEVSSEAPVISGVPQGSVLGPLLFVCYIYDLPDCVKSQVRLFADDSLLYRPIASMKDVFIRQRDLQELETWADKWKMHFNPTKCYVMRFCCSKSPTRYSYSLCNHIMEVHHTNPYLGILLSDDAKWGAHISKICRKANSTLGFLKRNLFNCPQELKKLAYITLIRSKLEYAACIWNPHLDKDISRIENIQRRSVRFITHNYNWTPVYQEWLKTLISKL